MEGKLHLRIEFLDGRPDHVEDVAMSYPPGAETSACMKLLADFNMIGGLLKVDKGECSLIPIATMKAITVTASEVVGGDMSDLANLKMPTARSKA